MLHRSGRLAAALLALIAVNCFGAGDLMEDLHIVEEPPPPEQIAGTWTVTSGADVLATAYGFEDARPELCFAQDGSTQVTGYPRAFLPIPGQPSPEMDRSLIDAPGGWSFEGSCVRIRFDDAELPEVSFLMVDWGDGLRMQARMPTESDADDDVRLVFKRTQDAESGSEEPR